MWPRDFATFGAEMPIFFAAEGTDLNEIEFRNFHRLGSKSRVLAPAQGGKQ